MLRATAARQFDFTHTFKRKLLLQDYLRNYKYAEAIEWTYRSVTKFFGNSDSEHDALQRIDFPRL